MWITISNFNPQGFDIAINSYLRSGSSFVGQLLGYRGDTFYWYEPMWNFNSGVFYWGQDSVCPNVPETENCGQSQAYRVSDGRCVGLHMQNVLVNIYSCNLSALVPAVAESMTPFYSGDSWKPFVLCRKNSVSSVSECLSKMERVCKSSKHRATKVVRLTLDNYVEVLGRVPALRLVHLFRDPRAVINSRQTTTWYHMEGEASVFRDARALCSRMMFDLEWSAYLTKKFPDRFIVVMFEDLQENLPQKSEILYHYFGMSTEGLEEKLAAIAPIKQNEKTITAEEGDYTGWWRKRLPYSTVHLVQIACTDVMNVLGYRLFNSESEQLNLNITAFNFSADWRLKTKV